MIINLTQHNATPEQLAQGLVEPPAVIKDRIKQLLTFSAEDIRSGQIGIRALLLARIAFKLEGAYDCSGDDPRTCVLIGGLPALMSPLEGALELYRMQAVYAHSDRVSVDVPSHCGTVAKQSVFQHQFFYPAVITGGSKI